MSKLTITAQPISAKEKARQLLSSIKNSWSKQTTAGDAVPPMLKLPQLTMNLHENVIPFNQSTSKISPNTTFKPTALTSPSPVIVKPLNSSVHSSSSTQLTTNTDKLRSGLVAMNPSPIPVNASTESSRDTPSHHSSTTVALNVSLSRTN